MSGDFDQFAQVFTNLIVNAGHAVELLQESGTLTLKSYYDAQKDYVVVEIRDNGPGIPEEVQGRVFEPFFTTKDVGKGTGVGLAFSHRIIESHGGLLELNSTTDKGTTFFVKLRSAKNIDEGIHNHQDSAQLVSNRHILVIDDEANVAQLVHDLLLEAGFKVTLRTDPTAALATLEGETFDAIVSDFKMPGMTGKQLYNAIKVVAPECAERIGFVTGDAMSFSVRTFFEESKRPHIEKPIHAGELLEMVTALLRNE